MAYHNSAKSSGPATRISTLSSQSAPSHPEISHPSELPTLGLCTSLPGSVSTFDYMQPNASFD
ncbi:predicted protein [Sclerotinia sclerotiorum 1980 UF-70]|uniref:Uncharacterized protein n=1 Tax=Sclerotinia sclerotiorum (strain ATCC 18683 / 1980 / Ss-1) TaxID=665079 RepID=A7E661_SCLS1|nr:predicted protein [Sclerotinia sclerotiorum 1980 UF-70]EDN91383.1 predicted protein [Sclerotinia sclerotiorum 1980 UF-70]